MGESEMLKKREALMALHSQTGEAQREQQQAVQQATNLSQLRPQVIRAVGEQERMATAVVSATWAMFSNAIAKNDDPALKKAVRESSLGNLIG